MYGLLERFVFSEGSQLVKRSSAIIIVEKRERSSLDGIDTRELVFLKIRKNKIFFALSIFKKNQDLELRGQSHFSKRSY